MNPHRARRLLPYTLFALGLLPLRLIAAAAVWLPHLPAGEPGADNRTSLWSAPQGRHVVLWALGQRLVLQVNGWHSDPASDPVPCLSRSPHCGDILTCRQRYDRGTEWPGGYEAETRRRLERQIIDGHYQVGAAARLATEDLAAAVGRRLV